MLQSIHRRMAAQGQGTSLSHPPPVPILILTRRLQAYLDYAHAMTRLPELHASISDAAAPGAVEDPRARDTEIDGYTSGRAVLAERSETQGRVDGDDVGIGGRVGSGEAACARTSFVLSLVVFF